MAGIKYTWGALLSVLGVWLDEFGQRVTKWAVSDDWVHSIIMDWVNLQGAVHADVDKAMKYT